MVDATQIGPGTPCERCGGEYGFHEGGCRNRRNDVEPAAPIYMGHARVNRRTGEGIEIDALRARIVELEAAIRKHRDQRGDDRCYLDDRELYGMLPEGYTPPPHDTAVTLEHCSRFIHCRQDPATEYVSPQRRIEQLEQMVADKDRLIASMAARIDAQAELLRQRAERPTPSQ